ncbi:MAG: Coq4 family protein [Pseudomonadota bacterium]
MQNSDDNSAPTLNFSIDAAALKSAVGVFTQAPDLGGLALPGNCADPAYRAQICGAMLWTGFCAPSASTPVYDAIAASVLDLNYDPQSMDAPEAPLPDSFWGAFAEVLRGPEEGYDAGTITAAVATLGGSVGENFASLAESAAIDHPGADHAEQKDIPALLSLDKLAACPEDSLAYSLYRMLVDNNFDPEVLDREAIGLSQLSPALRYLNTRILQMHDIWHLLAGYETTALHEIAISGFQLAQFGHNYSGMFLATVTTRSHLSGGEGFEILMRVIMEAWHHGRITPPLMAIEFEDEWHESINKLRQRHNIEAFQGSMPADLFEQLAAPAQIA